MTTQITIQGKVEATSKAGKQYWRVQTNAGDMTCFEKEVADKLVEGETINVEVKESNGFKNIRSISNDDAKPTTQVKPNVNYEKAREEKNKSIYVSYTKDIFNTLLTTQAVQEKEINVIEIMDLSIDLVQRAIKAFE